MSELVSQQRESVNIRHKPFFSQTVSLEALSNIIDKSLCRAQRRDQQKIKVIQQGIKEFNESTLNQMVSYALMRQDANPYPGQCTPTTRSRQETELNSSKLKWKIDIKKKALSKKSTFKKITEKTLRESTVRGSQRRTHNSNIKTSIKREDDWSLSRNSERFTTQKISSSTILSSRFNKKGSKTQVAFNRNCQNQLDIMQPSDQIIPLDEQQTRQVCDAILQDQFLRLFLHKKNQLESLLQEKPAQFDTSYQFGCNDTPLSNPKFTTDYNGEMLQFGLHEYLRKRRRKGHITQKAAPKLNSNRQNDTMEVTEYDKKPLQRVNIQHSIRTPQNAMIEQTNQDEEQLDGITSRSLPKYIRVPRSSSIKRNMVHLSSNVQDYFNMKQQKKHFLDSVLLDQSFKGLNLNSGLFDSTHKQLPQLYMGNQQHQKDMRSVSLSKGVTWLNRTGEKANNVKRSMSIKAFVSHLWIAQLLKKEDCSASKGVSFLPKQSIFYAWKVPNSDFP